MNSVSDCSVVALNAQSLDVGTIVVVENRKTIPFDVRRIYYLYDVPASEVRGGHAHRELYQLIVAAYGSFSVILNDGANTREILLDRPSVGLTIVPGIWRELEGFRPRSLCLVLASQKYDENDYIRNYEDFLVYKKGLRA